MKKTVLIIAIVCAGFSSRAQEAVKPAPSAVVSPVVQPVVVDPTANILEFKNAGYDFGKITFGKPVSYVVEITNISKDSVTLLNAHAGCGCTTPDFVPNQKFGPGQTVKVNIGFNSSVQGDFKRFTDISFSGGLTKQVYFTGTGIMEASPASAAPEKAKVVKH